MQAIVAPVVRYLLLPVLLLLHADPPKSKRQLGPEWTKGDENYTKTMEIPVSRPIGGNLTAYKVETDFRIVSFYEADEGVSLTTTILTKKLESLARVNVVRAPEKGYQANVFTANKVTYIDFDCDGIFDAYIDGRGKPRLPMILVDGKFIQVEDSKDGFAIGEKVEHQRRAVDSGKTYKFKDGKWVE